MPLPRRRRPDFDETRIFEYPQHLREAIEDLPAAPGVYIFHGEEGDLPLYIGKSVNIRSRVLSHLRNPDESRMLRQTRRITHICTAGEIGALLLEASMIKQQQPLMNQKLRRNRQLCSLQLADGRPAVVYSKDVNFATAPGLYGLFSSQRAALQALRDIADQHKLCYAALGLEKLPKGKACFRAMIRQCAGVCRGDETEQAHRDRLQGALDDMQVACWPFSGAVGLVERHGDMCQVHVVRNWTYLGSVSDVSQAKALDSMAAGFDADGYKILCKPILTSAVEMVVL
jgi:excinuclease Cho